MLPDTEIPRPERPVLLSSIILCRLVAFAAYGGINFRQNVDTIERVLSEIGDTSYKLTYFFFYTWALTGYRNQFIPRIVSYKTGTLALEKFQQVRSSASSGLFWMFVGSILGLITEGFQISLVAEECTIVPREVTDLLVFIPHSVGTVLTIVYLALLASRAYQPLKNINVELRELFVMTQGREKDEITVLIQRIDMQDRFSALNFYSVSKSGICTLLATTVSFTILILRFNLCYSQDIFKVKKPPGNESESGMINENRILRLVD